MHVCLGADVNKDSIKSTRVSDFSRFMVVLIVFVIVDCSFGLLALSISLNLFS
jgi:hypothetical protein